MQSGTTGINTMRVYNPVKQGHDQDPQGRFVRQWVPEVTEVPTPLIHEPWTWDGAASLAYPPPIVDHAKAAAAAREALHAVRKAAGHRTTASRIAEKHGSRKAGMPMTGQTSRRRAATSQLALDL
jgi:deoxyribodipyrimidine photo-lyase